MNPRDPFTLHIDNTATTVMFPSLHELRRAEELTGAFFCFDSNTAPLWSPAPKLRHIFPAGEQHKTLSHIEEAASQMLKAGLSRDGRVVAVGGGVVCDMAGLLASLYMRGVSLTLIPTTLLSMVDASVGGKTGVDFMGYKNVLGTFYPAERVYIAAEFLGSLPEPEFLNGLAEVIKHALLGDAKLLELLEEYRREGLAQDPQLTALLIARSLRMKARYVEDDPREAGGRAHLNLGHTFAHALERCGGLGRYGHGGAVAWGIGRALRLGERLGITDSGYRHRVERLLDSYGYRRSVEEIAPQELAAAMEADKKKRCGEVPFVLQRNLGETLQQTADRELLLEVLSERSTKTRGF